MEVDPRKGPVWQKAKAQTKNGVGLAYPPGCGEVRGSPCRLLALQPLHSPWVLWSQFPAHKCIKGEGADGCLVPCFPCEVFSRKPSFPDYLCAVSPRETVCPASRCQICVSVFVSLCVSVLPTPRLTFRLGLNLILLLYIPLALPVWEWA